MTHSRWFSISLELLNEYRKLDDAITMRLNRTNAQFRDRDRAGNATSKSSIQEQACDYLWRDLVGSYNSLSSWFACVHIVVLTCMMCRSENWKRRSELVGYCIDVVDHGIEDKRRAFEKEVDDQISKRKLQGDLFANETKVCLINTLFVRQWID
jgi:undecaprenyl pyrophosphate synthase